MNAEPNPAKINNQLNENISSSTVTLGKLIKQSKAQGKGDGLSTSSKTSKTQDNSSLLKFKDLYSQLESGKLTVDKFRSQVTEELKVTPQFERVLNDPHRSYRELVKTLEISKKTVNSDLVNTKKSSTIISSTALTTVKVPQKSNVNMEELNEKITNYAQGFTNRSDFVAYLNEKNIPVTSDL